MATYLSRATLQDRLTLAGLTAIASVTGSLGVADELRILDVLEDISGRIDSVIGGLGIDPTIPNRALEDIALDLAKAELWERVWVPVGLPERLDLRELAEKAEERLKEFRKGYRAKDANTTPGVTQVGRFSWRDVGNCPSDQNRGRALRSRMTRLP